MKKILPALSLPTSANPAFWVDAPRPRAKADGGAAAAPAGYAGGFGAAPAWSRERSRRLAAIRHYIIDDEPDLLAL